MDQLEKGWKKYRYKNITYLILSLIFTAILIETKGFKDILMQLGSFGYLSAFLGGALFVSTFTISIGTVILFLLAETLNPLLVGIIAGLGAVCGDLLIFNYFKNKGMENEIKSLFNIFGSDKIKHLIHTKYFRWSLPVLGALIVASPLPDEIGVGLMGISKMKTREFIGLSFILNTIGILIVISAGIFFKT